MKKELLEKIKRVRLLILDVDGVLTDGSIVYTNSGEELKRFDVKDGHGVKLLLRNGIDVAIITSRSSQAVSRRAEDLGIGTVYQGIKNKITALEEILRDKGLKSEEVAYIGDDLVDLPVILRVGFSCAVGDAVDEVRKRVDYVTEKRGGFGAVREVVEVILKAQNRWNDTVKTYLE